MLVAGAPRSHGNSGTIAFTRLSPESNLTAIRSACRLGTGRGLRWSPE